MKKVLFVLLALVFMAVAVSCDSSAAVSADAVLDFSNVEVKAGDKVVIDVTCGSKTMPRLEFEIDDPSQKSPKFPFKAIKRTSGTIAVKVYRQYEPVTKDEAAAYYLYAEGAVEIEEFSEQVSYNIPIYQINYYKITYDGNGATSGTVPASQFGLEIGQDVTLAGNAGNLDKTDCAFNGWNTEADGSGTHYDVASKVAGGFNGNTILYAEWIEGYKRVGGKIFYIHKDNGVTYTFYKEDKTIITDQTLAGLADAYWYRVSGTPTADKFYVYNDSAYSAYGDTWGWDDRPSSGYMTDFVYEYNIGYGKKLTGVYVPDGVTIIASIWYWLMAEVNDGAVGGSSDWFIPCAAELDKLKECNLLSSWFNDKYIFTSVEQNAGHAWVMNGSDGTYTPCGKGDYDSYISAVAIRAF